MSTITSSFFSVAQGIGLDPHDTADSAHDTSNPLPTQPAPHVAADEAMAATSAFTLYAPATEPAGHEYFAELSALGEAAAAGVPRQRLEEHPWRMWHIQSLTAFPPGTSYGVPSSMMPVARMLGLAVGRPLPGTLANSYVAEMRDAEFLHIDGTGKITRLPGAIANAAGDLDIVALLTGLGVIPTPCRRGIVQTNTWSTMTTTALFACANISSLCDAAPSEPPSDNK